MPRSETPFVVTAFLFEGKIYLWLGHGAARPAPKNARLLDTLTQRSDETEPQFFRRVNLYARFESLRTGAEFLCPLMPEDASAAN